ncbi:zinc finger-containing ubiquitin peptidase 1 [Menidia menidia]
MLSCEICGEEVMLEEDMKTHLLISHLENDMCCPLCCLSGVSYDELCFHITSAHPEEQHKPQGPTRPAGASGSSGTRPAGASGSSGTASGVCESGELCAAGDSGRAGAVSTAASAVSTNTVTPSPRSEEASALPAALIVQEPESTDKDELPPLPKRKKIFSCPMCALMCSSAFVLQEHVELHLQDQYSDQGSPGSDLKLATQLQQEEAQRRRQEDEEQEREQFKRLQRQFGLDGRGGYRRQMEKTMARAVASGLLEPAEFHQKRASMMESLASGVDDGTTRTQGVIRALYEYYQSGCRDCVHVWLSAETDHYCSSAGDKGWGCGYRNFQMLLSSLHRTDTYFSLLQGKAVPSVPQVQSMIEEAWKEGLDPQGASHFNQCIKGTRAWIGATEIYILLTCLGISARIIDFHQPSGADGTHPRLFDWVKEYFCQAHRSSRLPPRVNQTSLPPLYLQHQGHSRCIVGVEQRKNGSLCLLLLDPACSASDTRKLLSRGTVSTSIRHVRKFPTSLKHKQYQLVAAQGVLSAQDKQVRILNSRTFCAERVP